MKSSSRAEWSSPLLVHPSISVSNDSHLVPVPEIMVKNGDSGPLSKPSHILHDQVMMTPPSTQSSIHRVIHFLPPILTIMVNIIHGPSYLWKSSSNLFLHVLQIWKRKADFRANREVFFCHSLTSTDLFLFMFLPGISQR